MAIDVERHVGPLSLRAWGLVVNLAGNVLLLHGGIQYAETGGAICELAAGVVVTAVCIALLAIPSR